MNPREDEPNKSTPRYVIAKLLKTKNKLKVLEALRKMPEITLNQDPIYSDNISFKNEGDIKTFSYKGKLRESVASRFILKEWLNLKTERK